MKKTTIALLVILVATALNISAHNDAECNTCKKSGPISTTVRRTGELVGNTVRRTGELAGDTVRRTGELAGDTVKDAANILSFSDVKKEKKKKQKDKNKKLKAERK
jgi:hypothetical protein